MQMRRIENLIVELIAEVRGLRADFRAATPMAGKSQDDVLAGHLAAIERHVQRRTFTVLDLVEHCEVAESEALRDALIGLAGALNGRRVGQALARMEGVNLDGLMVRRSGTGREGAYWRVCEFAESETHQKIAPRLVKQK
jgi:hypothetical protein